MGSELLLGLTFLRVFSCKDAANHLVHDAPLIEPFVLRAIPAIQVSIALHQATTATPTLFSITPSSKSDCEISKCSYVVLSAGALPGCPLTL